MLAQFPPNVIRVAVPSGLRADVRAELDRLERLRVEALQDAAPSDARDFLSVLAVVALKMRGGKVAELRPVIEGSYGGAMAIIDALDLAPDNFQELINRLGSQSATLENAAAFLAEFRPAARDKRLAQDLETFPSAIAPLLAPLMTILSKPESDNAYATVQKNIGVLKQPALNSAYNATTTEQLGDVAQLQQNLHAIAKRIVGKAVNSLSREQAGQVRQADPQGYKEFMAAQAALKQRSDAAVRQAVQELGEDKATLKAVSAKLAEMGVPNPFHPDIRNTSYVKVNYELHLCNKLGQQLTRDGFPPNVRLEVNKNHDPHAEKRGNQWVINVHQPTGGKPGAVLVAEKSAENKAKVFQGVRETAERLDEIKANWRKKFRGNKEDEKTIFAYIAEFMYWVPLRSGGNNGMTDGERTFGISDLEVQHLMLGGRRHEAEVQAALAAGPNMLKFNFLGKSGSRIRFALNPNADSVNDDERRYMKSLIAFVVEKCKGKKSNDLIFTHDGQRISMGRYNTWLRSLGAQMTSKGFRKLRGTALAKETLPEATEKVMKLKAGTNKRVADKDIHAAFYAAMLPVGQLLGHLRGEDPTPDTAIAAYVDATVMLGWYSEISQQLGYPVAPPPKVKLAAKKAGIKI